MNINQGYPGDKLSKTRKEFIDSIREAQERQKNIQAGESCMKWMLVIIVLGLLFLCYLWSRGYFMF